MTSPTFIVIIREFRLVKTLLVVFIVTMIMIMKNMNNFLIFRIQVLAIQPVLPE